MGRTESSALGTALSWGLVYVSCAALGFLRTGACSSRPTLCVHPYWLEGWLLDYSQGFHRRGLLGALTRLVWPGPVDIVGVNALALSVGVGLVASLAALLHRSAATPWGRPAVAVLLATPVCALLFEVLGDSLEIVLALFVGLALALRGTEARALRLAACAAFALVAVAIHEAAIFLFVPAAVLLATRPARPGLASYVRYAAVAAPLLAVTMLDAGPLRVDRDLRVVNSFTGAEVPRMADEPYPSFTTLLREELATATASPKAALEFATHVPRTWFVPCLALLLVSFALWRDARALVLWRGWLYLTVCSLPLYAIGHDWGRFSVLTFWIAVVTAYSAPPAENADARSRVVTWLFPLPAPPAAAVFGVASALLLAAEAISIDYRGTMLPRRSLLLFVPAAFAWYRWRRAVTSP